MQSQKPYLTDYKILIVQELWQAHYPILLIILLKDIIKLNVNTKTMIKNVKLAELNSCKNCDCFLQLKDDLIEQELM